MPVKWIFCISSFPFTTRCQIRYRGHFVSFNKAKINCSFIQYLLNYLENVGFSAIQHIAGFNHRTRYDPFIICWKHIRAEIQDWLDAIPMRCLVA